MRAIPMFIGLTLVAGLVTGAVRVEIGGSDWNGAAIAATAKQKSQSRQSLERVRSSLRAVDTAYASGNAAEAQTRLEEARSTWNEVAPSISTREAREQQLLLDSLGDQLKSGAPATKVKSTISGMLDELREDIERELR
jgi:1,2-phenylacetyl-CoA epoxidase PaaB subunit